MSQAAAEEFWLERYSGTITSLATVILVLVTGVYVWLTYRLATLQQRQFDLASRSTVDCALSNKPDGTFLTVTNRATTVTEVEVVGVAGRTPLRRSYPRVAQGEERHSCVSSTPSPDGVLLLQYQDGRQRHYRQVWFFHSAQGEDADGGASPLYASARPSEPEPASTRVELGSLRTPTARRDEEVAGYPISALVGLIKAAWDSGGATQMQGDIHEG